MNTEAEERSTHLCNLALSRVPGAQTDKGMESMQELQPLCATSEAPQSAPPLPFYPYLKLPLTTYTLLTTPMAHLYLTWGTFFLQTILHMACPL